jgi:hypothetical protein
MYPGKYGNGLSWWTSLALSLCTRRANYWHTTVCHAKSRVPRGLTGWQRRTIARYAIRKVSIQSPSGRLIVPKVSTWVHT